MIADAVEHKLIGEIPTSDAPRPIVISKDEKRFYANVDTLIGIEIADIEKRKVIHRVEVCAPEESQQAAAMVGLRLDEKEL